MMSIETVRVSIPKCLIPIEKHWSVLIWHVIVFIITHYIVAHTLTITELNTHVHIHYSYEFKLRNFGWRACKFLKWFNRKRLVTLNEYQLQKRNKRYLNTLFILKVSIISKIARNLEFQTRLPSLQNNNKTTIVHANLLHL